MPTSSVARRTLLEHLPPDLEGKVIDLGSGWGNLIMPLAKRYPKAKIVGYENSPLPYTFSNLLNVQKNLTIHREDFYGVPLDDADCVVCYLHPKGMERLKEKFERELRPGTPVISHTFAIPGWKPEKTIQVDDLHHSRLYFYRSQQANQG